MDNLFRCIKLHTPCRIEIITQEAFDNIDNITSKLSLKHIVSVEDPLPPSKNNGVKKIIFLDKHLLSKTQSIETWLQM